MIVRNDFLQLSGRTDTYQIIDHSDFGSPSSMGFLLYADLPVDTVSEL